MFGASDVLIFNLSECFSCPLQQLSKSFTVPVLLLRVSLPRSPTLHEDVVEDSENPRQNLRWLSIFFLKNRNCCRDVKGHSSPLVSAKGYSGVAMVASLLALSLRQTCQYPLRASQTMRIFALNSCGKRSSIIGIG